MAIRTVFWDIGGVILTNGWDHGQRSRVLRSLGYSSADLAAYELRHDEANYFWERGLSTDAAFFDRTVFYQPRSFGLPEIWKGIRSEQAVLHPECLEILSRLKVRGEVRQATLNNESRELNDYRLRTFALRRFFAFAICSGYVHEMKPNPGIFRSALEISGDDPAATVFIDDKRENVIAAEALGMHGIHFTTPENLEHQLRSLGIEV